MMGRMVAYLRVFSAWKHFLSGQLQLKHQQILPLFTSTKNGSCGLSSCLTNGPHFGVWVQVPAIYHKWWLVPVLSRKRFSSGGWFTS